MLYLIATPIGNLQDFTFRAIETIRNCDYLLCEDTRRSRILLDHYELKKPLKSFHRLNERSKATFVLSDLKEGKTIGLLSDAGTPGISDPGEKLVRKCREEDIPVVSIPGPCAAIVALSTSGFDSSRFQFFGFLPKKKGKLKKLLNETLLFPGTSLCYESPYRLVSTLKILVALDPERKCGVARELTKKFETFVQGTSLEVLSFFEKSPPKGEIVLLIGGIED